MSTNQHKAGHTDTKAADSKQTKQPGEEHAMTPEPEYIKPGYKGSGRLEGKVALVTGGDSGIGRGGCIHFAREGEAGAIVYFDEEKDAQDTQQLIEKEGRKCKLIKGDVRDSVFCKQAVKQTVDTLG